MPFEAVVATLAVGALAVWSGIYHRGPAGGTWDVRIFTLYIPSAFTFTFVLLVGRALGTNAAILGAIVILGFFAARFAFGSLRRRDFERLCAKLATSGDDASVAAVDASLERIRRSHEGRSRGYEAWARWVLYAAAQASQADRTADALRWTCALRTEELPPSLRAMRAQYVAAFAIAQGRREQARQALAAVPRPAPSPRIEQALLGTEGVLEGLEGDASAARRRAERALATKLDPAVRLMWQTTRAHALATLGESAEARAVLLALRDENGEFMLRRIARQGGPASPLASALLQDAAPYR